MKSVWFAYIVLTSVVFAAIAAMVASALGAPPLTVLPWTAATFAATLGMGFTAYHFFRTP